MPTRRSNQRSYEDTYDETGSFGGSNLPVMNESMNAMIYHYEMNHILNCGYEAIILASLDFISFYIYHFVHKQCVI